MDDFRICNRDFAKIGGVNNAELNLLELELLKTLDFNLVVPRAHFEGYVQGILSCVLPAK